MGLGFVTLNSGVIHPGAAGTFVTLNSGALWAAVTAAGSCSWVPTSGPYVYGTYVFCGHCTIRRPGNNRCTRIGAVRVCLDLS